MKIVLCGMMGCGKTTVGKRLAEKFGLPFLDTDEWIIERFGDISSIFDSRGEAYFRTLETDAVKALGALGDAVVSVGGGLVLNEENVEKLKTQGKIVYLQASKETLLERLLGDETRPLLKGGLSERLEKLLKERISVYENVCDLCVCVDKKTPDEIADEIAKKMNLLGAGA